MYGSKPLITYKLENTQENRELLKDCIKQLTADEWCQWYVDFYVDWNVDPIEFQIFKERLLVPVRNLLFEKMI